VSILQGIKSSYTLFGLYGVLLVVKARLLRRPIQVVVSKPGAHPLYLRLRTTDISLFWDILVNDEYDWKPNLMPRVIVDAGANIGLTSVSFANKYPEAKIFAVEPESSNYEILTKNTAAYPNIVPVHAALWKDNEDLNLVNPGGGHWGFQARELAQTDYREKCKHVVGMTVDKLMSDYRVSYIDILKVDIEGAEKEVFEDSSRWIDRVGVIMIELHDRLKVGCSRSVYSAVRDFECEWRKGETTVLARSAYVEGKGREEYPMRTSYDAAAHPVRPKLPLRIREAG